jgi:hypothetical protein
VGVAARRVDGSHGRDSPAAEWHEKQPSCRDWDDLAKKFECKKRDSFREHHRHFVTPFR